MSSIVRKFDIAILGAGVVGLNLAFWISELYDYSVILIDKEPGVGFHQSMRNTGGVHRPVFVDANSRSGKWMEKSYELWRILAQNFNLPFNVIGRITLAIDEEDAFMIERANKWAVANGLSSDEIEFVTGNEVRKFEPNVSCVVGVVAKKEAVTSYGQMCEQLLRLCEENGVIFAKGIRVENIKETLDGIELDLREVTSNIQFQLKSSFAINATGGAALKLAKKLGMGNGYVDLHLRGAYYRVEGSVVDSIKRQVYPLTRHGIEGIDVSYTGPHLVTRMDGMGGWRKELGPTAAPVLGPYAYRGLSDSFSDGFAKIFDDVNSPMLKMLANREFLSFAWNQWKMVRSKDNVVNYLKKCIPELTKEMIVGEGYAGILVEYMNEKGFVSEPVSLFGNFVLHILYTGAGATGSPAYAAHLLQELGTREILTQSRAKRFPKHNSMWSIDSVLS